MFSITEAARQLGLCRSSVAKLCDSGRLECVRPMGPTGHRRFTQDAIDRYLSSLTPASPETIHVPKTEYAPSSLNDVFRQVKELTK